MRRTQISLGPLERQLLDREAARTGRSMSALIRDAVERTYGDRSNMGTDLKAINVAAGAWQDLGFDGQIYTEGLRTGGRLEGVDEG